MKQCWTRLLATFHDSITTGFNRLKQAPGPATPKTVTLWTNRLGWMDGLIDPDPLLESIAHTKLRRFAAEAAALEVGDILDITQPGRRHTLLLDLLRRAPGGQGQVDLARFEVTFTDEPGAKRIVWLFSLVLGCSRLIWARFVLHQDLGTLLRCHVAAFQAIGGVPREILYDRMKTAVLGQDVDGLVIYNRALLDLARHFGFQPKACRSYRPKTKGKVERPFRYIREDFFRAGSFRNLEDLNGHQIRCVRFGRIGHLGGHLGMHPPDQRQDVLQLVEPLGDVGTMRAPIRHQLRISRDRRKRAHPVRRAARPGRPDGRPAASGAAPAAARPGAVRRARHHRAGRGGHAGLAPHAGRVR